MTAQRLLAGCPEIVLKRQFGSLLCVEDPAGHLRRNRRFCGVSLSSLHGKKPAPEMPRNHAQSPSDALHVYRLLHVDSTSAMSQIASPVSKNLDRNR
jgi:hypothetical protein